MNIPKYIAGRVVEGLRIIVGIIMVIIGIIGLIMPILPGWLFIILGLIVLGYKKEVLWIRDKIINFIKKKKKQKK